MCVNALPARVSVPKEQLAQCEVAVVSQTQLRAELRDLGYLGCGVGDVCQQLLRRQVPISILIKACQLKALCRQA